MEKTIKILLIDDDAFIRILVKDIFWIHGKGKYQIYDIDSLEKGEKLIEEIRPDLIFLDLMFKKNGLDSESSLEFLKKIKSTPNTKDIKVIVFSGYPDLKEETLKLGAEKFLIKGEYLPQELFKIAESILEGK